MWFTKNNLSKCFLHLNLFLSFLFFIASLYPQFASLASSDNAKSLQIVKAQIQIVKISDLDFGNTFQGAPLKVIDANILENPENASFLVLGEPNSSFTVSLPISSVFLNHSILSDQIQVDQFTSEPSINGSLSSAGERLLFVGARRPALATSISPGVYSGTFAVTVVY